MKREIKYIVIHCTATPAGRVVGPADVKRWHQAPPPAGRGWSRPGYHFLVGLFGEVWQLHPLNEDCFIDEDEITYGARGYNAESIHIAYAGGVAADGHTPKDTRTPAQRRELRALVASLKKIAPRARVLGHRDLPGCSKACPSFDVETQL